MSELLLKIKFDFESCTAREQLLIVLAGLFVIVGLSFFFFLQPLSDDLLRAERNTAQISRSMAQVESENAARRQKLNTSPDQPLKDELAVLKAQIEQLDDALANKVESLVNASDMPALLESVLRKSSQLKLISMTSLQPERITTGHQSEDAAAQQQSHYYIHPVSLTLEGNYFDMMNYLAALEALPVQYFWRQARYEVTNYPIGRMTMTVYTISESAIFIGGMK